MGRGDWPKYALDGVAIVTFLEACSLLKGKTLKERYRSNGDYWKGS
jgi:hypothetical protein